MPRSNMPSVSRASHASRASRVYITRSMTRGLSETSRRFLVDENVRSSLSTNHVKKNNKFMKELVNIIQYNKMNNNKMNNNKMNNKNKSDKGHKVNKARHMNAQKDKGSTAGGAAVGGAAVATKPYDNLSEIVKTLSIVNAHKRDSRIRFQEFGHIYYVKDNERDDTQENTSYKSVTSVVKKFSHPFDADKVITRMLASNKNKKYEGMTPDEIKKSWNKNSYEARTYGTNMHYAIECYFNNLALTNNDDLDSWENYWREKDISMEFGQFSQFVKNVIMKEHLFPYRTEWSIYDEQLKITGSIDMVFKNDKGGYEIYDWKRSKDIRSTGFDKLNHPALEHLPDCNFWIYTLQLNLYKYILERKYDMRIDNLVLVVFHPENGENVFKKHKCPDLQNELRMIFQEE